jgi:hypothetical protein
MLMLEGDLSVLSNTESIESDVAILSCRPPVVQKTREVDNRKIKCIFFVA